MNPNYKEEKSLFLKFAEEYPLLTAEQRTYLNGLLDGLSLAKNQKKEE